jgi:hypothetical protein
MTALVGVLFWAGMGIAGMINYCYDTILRRDFPLWAVFAVGGGGTSLVLTLAGTMIAGARRLLRFEGYELVVAAAVLAILPWSPHYLMGMVTGTWTFRTLKRSEVAAAFAARLRRKKRRPGSSVLTLTGGEPPRPAAPGRGRVRSFLRSLRSVFVGSRS